MEILSITVPIFLFVAIGYILRRKGIISEDIKSFLSKIVYYFAFPALTFRSIISFDFASTFRIRLVLHNLSVTAIIFITTFFLAFLIKDNYKRGAFNMGCFRTNQGYMGMPIVKGFYGEAAMSRAAIVNGFDSSAVIIMSVLALEAFRGRRAKSIPGDCETVKGSKPAWCLFAEKFISFISNPFVISALLGIILAYYRVPVLKIRILDVFLQQAGNMALPLALLSIGCSIEIKHLKDNLKLVLGTSVIKLLIAPVIAFLLGFFVFKFKEVDLGMSVILISNPTSVSSYVMACEMDTDENLMAAIIGFTTFISIATISLMQYVLKLYFL